MNKFFTLASFVLLCFFFMACSKADFVEEEDKVEVTFNVLGIKKPTFETVKDKATSSKLAFGNGEDLKQKGIVQKMSTENMRKGVKYGIVISEHESLEPFLYDVIATSGEESVSLFLEPGKVYYYLAYTHNDELLQAREFGSGPISPSNYGDLLTTGGTFTIDTKKKNFIDLEFQSRMTEVEFFLDLSDVNANIHPNTKGSLTLNTQLSSFQLYNELFSRGAVDVTANLNFKNLPITSKTSLGKFFIIRGPSHHQFSVRFDNLSFVTRAEDRLFAYTNGLEYLMSLYSNDIEQGGVIHYVLKIKFDENGNYQPKLLKSSSGQPGKSYEQELII